MFEAILLLAALGFIFGLGLFIASKKFAVETDPRIEEIADILPGANCGACGRTGCFNFAEALVHGSDEVGQCAANSAEDRCRIATILGVELSDEGEKKVAVVLCQGARAVEKYRYAGIKECRAAALIHGGQKECAYGCLGFGTCVAACPFGAITMRDGLPVIDEERCTACGKCVSVCPHQLIEIHPVSHSVFVKCKSKDLGKIVNKICDTGCIACKKCEKECPVDAIHVENKLAVIDYEKCTACGKCVKVCPNNTIVTYRKERKEREKALKETQAANA